jgi:cyclin B
LAHREGNKGNKEHGREATRSFIKRKWTQDLGGNSLHKPSRRAKLNSTYAEGTAVSKIVDEGGGESRKLRLGVVTGFDANEQLYHIKFDDGDEELMNHEELSKIALKNNTGEDKSLKNQGKKIKTTVAPVTLSPVKGEDVGPSSQQCHDLATDIDKLDSDDPLSASSYVQEMYEHYRSKEADTCTNPTYMDDQKFINERMRAILIDWLVDVHLKFKLVPETLHLTVNIIDRYLAKERVIRQRLQLLGVTAFLIATKYEEVYPPEIPDLVYICAGSYTKYEILEMEETILKKLDYRITIPSAHAFLVRYLKAGLADKKIVSLSSFILDGTLVSYDLLRYLPSQLAAAAVLIARKAAGHNGWNTTLDKYARYSEDDILPVARAILSEQSLVPTELRAVRNKYRSTRYGSVANIEMPSL